MTPEQKRLVQTSFEQVAPIAEDAAGLFYNRLFELDPALRPLFKGDLKEQGRKLMQMIGVVVKGLDRFDELVPAAQAMGQRHAGYGVKCEDYEMVGAALLWTLGKGLGVAFTHEIKDAWTAAYGALTAAMKSAIAPHQAATPLPVQVVDAASLTSRRHDLRSGRREKQKKGSFSNFREGRIKDHVTFKNQSSSETLPPEKTRRSRLRCAGANFTREAAKDLTIEDTEARRGNRNDLTHVTHEQDRKAPEARHISSRRRESWEDRPLVTRRAPEGRHKEYAAPPGLGWNLTARVPRLTSSATDMSSLRD
jgi:hemoglobin-like flavoprotein